MSIGTLPSIIFPLSNIHSTPPPTTFKGPTSRGRCSMSFPPTPIHLQQCLWGPSIFPPTLNHLQQCLWDLQSFLPTHNHLQQCLWGPSIIFPRSTLTQPFSNHLQRINISGTLLCHFPRLQLLSAVLMGTLPSIISPDYYPNSNHPQRTPLYPTPKL